MTVASNPRHVRRKLLLDMESLLATTAPTGAHQPPATPCVRVEVDQPGRTTTTLRPEPAVE